MGKIEEFLEKKRELEQIIKQFGTDAMKEFFNGILDKYPKLYGFGWTQYTPYYNDGDECVFGVYSPGVFATEEEYQQVADDEVSLYEFDEYSIDDPELKEAYTDIEKSLNDMEDILRSVFGDHVQILVRRDDIITEEYSHD